jgi:hypothetical protein
MPLLPQAQLSLSLSLSNTHGRLPLVASGASLIGLTTGLNVAPPKSDGCASALACAYDLLSLSQPSLSAISLSLSVSLCLSVSVSHSHTAPPLQVPTATSWTPSWTTCATSPAPTRWR